jgi:cytochrome c oxidase subunit III
MEGLIPYIVHPREDTGLTNGKIGIWLFLASEIMLFGAFFATYIVLRVGSPAWPHGAQYLNIPLATLNTVVLITSSVTVVMAWVSLMRDDVGRYKTYMLATVLLGGCFMVIKYIEYTSKFEHHLYPSTNNFLGLYFTMTGLHALHVFLGMAVNGYFWATAQSYWAAGEKQLLIGRVENAGLFWHFVDVVWIFLFPVLYLL